MHASQFLEFRIRVLLGFIRICFSEGDLRGRKVPLEEKRERKDVGREKEELKE